MTPTTVARAKTLAKSLRAEAGSYGFDLQLSACQSIIAAGSGSPNWHHMTSRILDGQSPPSWNSELASAELAIKADVEPAIAAACMLMFQLRVDPHMHEELGETSSETPYTIFDVLKFELVDGLIVASEKGDDDIWRPIGSDDVELFVPASHTSTDIYPFHYSLLVRASKVGPENRLDRKKIVAGLKKHTDFPFEAIDGTELLDIMQVVGIKMCHYIDHLIFDSGTALFEYDSPLDAVDMMPGGHNLTRVNRYIANFKAISSLRASYRPFLRYLPLAEFERVDDDQAARFKQKIDEGVGLSDDPAELKALKWLRTASQVIVERVLCEVKEWGGTFSPPQDMIRNPAFQYHPSMIEASQDLGFHERQDFDAFGIIQEIVSEIEDPGEAFATQGWLARQTIRYTEEPVLADGFEDLLDGMRDIFHEDHPVLELYDAEIFLLQRADGLFDDLRLHFGDCAIVQKFDDDPLRYIPFLVDNLGSSLRDISLVLIDTTDGTLDIACVDDLAATGDTEVIAGVVASKILQAQEDMKINYSPMR